MIWKDFFDNYSFADGWCRYPNSGGTKYDSQPKFIDDGCGSRVFVEDLIPADNR